jgi:hypothetical protein
MDKQSNQNKNHRSFAGNQSSKPTPPGTDSPMEKFNKAMKKILSVPKKNLRDK